jgi:methyl-accepting chemotaxis protein
LVAKLIKPFWSQWLAVMLPAGSTLVLAVFCVAGTQQALQQRLWQHDQQAVLLHLDDLSAQLTLEQLSAWQQDLTQWDTRQRKTRATWQQLLGTGSREENTTLAPLKNSFNQLIWAQKNDPNNQGVDGDAYTPVLDQVATASRQLASSLPNGQHLVQLRQLHRHLQGLQQAVKGILTHQAADIDGLMLLQQTQWLAQWMQPTLTDRQQRLFTELFDGGWQSLRGPLADSLAEDNPLDKNLTQELQELNSLTAALDSLLADSRDQLTQQIDNQTSDLQNQIAGVWLLALILPCAGLLTLWLTLQQQASRLQTAQNWAQTLACGNLTASPQPRLTGDDPLGQMVLAVDELRHHWRRTLTQIHAHCDALQTLATARANWLDEQPVPNEHTPLPHRPMVDLPVLADDFMMASPPLVQAEQLQTQLSSLNQTSQQLADSIAHWQGDTETLSQHLHQMTDPMQQQLKALMAMAQQLHGLGSWVDTLNDYAAQSQQLVDHTLSHAAQLAAHDDADLHTLQQEVTQTQQQLAGLMQQLQQAQPPAITRLASQTSPQKPGYHPLQGLRRLLAEFSF